MSLAAHERTSRRALARAPGVRALIFLAIAVFLLVNACSTSGAPLLSRPRAARGVLDLSRWNLQDQGSVALDGEWEFYWSAFVDPGAPDDVRSSRLSGYLKVPGTWNGFAVEGRSIGGEGFATYRLVIRLADEKQRIAFKLLDMATAYTLYVDGEKLAGSGVPGTTGQTSRPAYVPQLREFQPSHKEIEVVIHVSNFHHRSGGAWESIGFGLAADMRNSRERVFDLRGFLLGCILVMSCYHFGLFALRRNARAPLYFAIFCLLIAARELTTGERLAVSLVPGLGWELLSKIEYLSAYCAGPVFMLYLRSLFKQEIPKWALYGILGISFCLMGVVIASPVMVYSYSVLVFQPFLIAYSLYAVAAIIQAVAHRREGAAIVLGGFIVLFLAVLNDTLYARGIISSANLVTEGFVLFIVIQAFLLSRSFSTAFTIIEKQRGELQTEISERKHAEKALQDAYDVISTSPTVAFRWRNEKGWPVEFVTDNVRHLFGYSVQDFVSGRVVYEQIIHPDDLSRVHREVAGVSTEADRKRLVHDPYRIIARDGTAKWVSDRTFVKRDDSGTITHYEGVVEDISERVRAEEELSRYRGHLEELVKARTRDLEAAKREAEDSNRAKSQFLANMSHELRTPLNHVLGFTDLILTMNAENLTPTQKEFLGDIQGSGKHLLSLINDLLDLTKVEAGRMELAVLPTDPKALLEKSLNVIKEHAYSRGIRIELDVDALPTEIPADERKILQVLYNLLSNAVKFTPEGGTVRLSAWCSNPQTGLKTPVAAREASHFAVRISDTGTGIKEADLERIFLSFEQVDNPHAARPGGTGLGLALTRRYVQMHGGRIWAESGGLNKGSSFYFTIPLRENR